MRNLKSCAHRKAHEGKGSRRNRTGLEDPSQHGVSPGMQFFPEWWQLTIRVTPRNAERGDRPESRREETAGETRPASQELRGELKSPGTGSSPRMQGAL